MKRRFEEIGAFAARMGEQLKCVPPGLLVCKALFVVICLTMVIGGHHPPASAQQTASADVYGLEVRSAVQESRMDQLRDKEDRMEGRMSKMWDVVNANTNAISGFQGETRGIGALLILLQLGQMLFAQRKNKAGSA